MPVDDTRQPGGLIKSALFVDFDNIYLGLATVDPAAAELFASDPARWMAWFERGMPGPEDQDGERLERRAILIRRCYLNPATGFHRFRPFFIRSAFSVIDCPPLTKQGKTNADIQMVMDILDTLDHPTHFDEFIILSGDSDFTPMLLRLRAYNRRTSILAVGPAAEAYKAACDRAIMGATFIECALGIGTNEQFAAEAPVAPRLGAPADRLLNAMADKVYEEASATGELPATALPRIFMLFPEFKAQGNWLGFFSLRKLVTDLVRRKPELRVVEGDPWKVSVVLPHLHAPAAVAESGEAGQQALAALEDEAALRGQIVARVRQIVANAAEPVTMARAAGVVVKEFGARVVETQWAGAGTFKNLLQGTPELGFSIAVSPDHPGYLYDPERHQSPNALARPQETSGFPAGMATLARNIHQVTGIPLLSLHQYALVFRLIVQDLKARPYNLTATSKAVRDLCIERGESISRGSISFILQGIIFAGHRFGADPDNDTPAGLARAFRKQVATLCTGAQLELSPEEHKLIDDWIAGEAQAPAPAAEPAAEIA